MPTPEPTTATGELDLVATVERLRGEVEGLRQALRSRAPIEQAKGMLMERYGCTPDDAFQRLATLSQHANIKLADVAAALVGVATPQAGTSPTAGGPRRTTPTAGAHRAPAAAAATPARGDVRQEPSVSEGGASATAGEAAAPTPGDVVRSSWRQVADRWPRQVSGSGEFGIQVRAQGRRTRVKHELMAARAPHEVLNSVISTALAAQPPQVAALGLIDVNGVLTLAASHGIPGPVAARWQTVPIDLPFAVCETARTSQPQWLTADPGGPVSHQVGWGIPDGWAQLAVLPLVLDGASHGVLALAWGEHDAFDASTRSGLDRIAADVAEAVLRLPPTPSGGISTFEGIDPTLAVLDALYHPVMLWRPVLDAEGRLTDLQLTYANAAADFGREGQAALRGRRLLELWPRAARSGLLEACRKVLTTGAQAELGDYAWQASVQGESRTGLADLRITRYRDGVLLTWARVRVLEPSEVSSARKEPT